MNKDMPKKHHFWFLLGVVPLLVLLSLVMVTSGVGGEIEAKQAAVESAKKDLAAKQNPKPNTLIGKLDDQRKLLEGKQTDLWKANWERQIGVTAKYNFHDGWFVTGHGGYLRSRTTAGITVGNVSASEKSWNNGWYAGAGVGYDVTRNVSLALNYDNYHVKNGRGGSDQPQTNANVAAYSASVEYRF